MVLLIICEPGDIKLTLPVPVLFQKKYKMLYTETLLFPVSTFKLTGKNLFFLLECFLSDKRKKI